MATITAPQLLQLKDADFDSRIKDMSLKNLLETITLLQREMSKEQENFNSLSSELGGLKKSSGQYKSISKDMAASQTRLTLLMDRSMKCFSQQGTQQNKNAAERRNSLQDSHNRSSSQNRNSEPVKSATFNKPVIQSNENNVSKTTVSVQSKSTVNGVNGSNTNTAVTGAGNMSQTKLNGSNTGNSASFNGNKGSNGVSANGDKKPENSSQSLKPGPLQDQSNKFTSKSMDNLSRPSTAQKSDVVSSVQYKPASKVVLSADKQMIDLDSFTDRRNMLNELKKFDKELKPVVGSKSDKVTEVKLNLAKSGEKRSSTNNEEKVPQLTTPGEKTNVFGDIKLGRKPSELKQVKPETNHNIQKKTEPNIPDSVKPSDFVKPVLKPVVKPADMSNKPESRTDIQSKQFDDLLKGVSDSDGSSDDSPRGQVTTHVTKLNMAGQKTVQSIPAVYCPDESRFAASGEVTVDESRRDSTIDGSEDNHSVSSEYSEDDDKFVTEFHFSGSQFTAPAGKETVATKKQDSSKQTQDVIPKTQKTVEVQKAQEPKPVSVQKPVQEKTPVQTQPDQTQKTVAAVPDQKTKTTPPSVITPAAGGKVLKEGDELVKDTRVKFKDWDPAKLLERLYEVKMMPDNVEDISHKFIGMEGLMEKLPMNKKKATLLKTWKRRFFRAKDGWLHYYESGNKDKPSDSLQLMGGKVEELGPRVLGVDDGRGKYLMVRVPTDIEYGQWKVALESQTADNVKATYVRPAPASIQHPKKKVVIIDIGSSAIRAGILGERATLPTVFFPSIVAIHKQTGEIVVGPDALKPDVRKNSTVIQPIQPTNKVDKFNIDMAVMTEILKKVFKDLGVNQSQFMVMLSTPQNLGDKLRGGLMRILIDELQVRGVCMVQQSLLALYSYNATSGIIVDIGERLEILPIYDGLLIDHGVSRQAYGGTKIQDSLYISLLENRYEFNSPVEKYLVRYLAEQACYVTDNYKENKEKCDKDPNSYSRVVDLQEFDLPTGAYPQVTMDYACFKSPEGFFNTDLWEMDYKNLQKQIYSAIQQCPIDSRKQMYRSVYLSGGVTTIPGFSERLEVELRKLAPPAAVVEVHASPQRYHSAYIGACSVAAMDVFEMSCVSADEWKKIGVAACKKWGTG